jgi:hypothetical protein
VSSPLKTWKDMGMFCIRLKKIGIDVYIYMYT